MEEIFRKGQIIPRRLRRVLYQDRKAQHNATFGCDVMVNGNTFSAITDGSLIHIIAPGRRMKNGTRKKTICVVKKINFISVPNAQGEPGRGAWRAWAASTKPATAT